MIYGRRGAFLFLPTCVRDLADRVLADDVTELGELARDPAPAAGRVVPDRAHDELDHRGIERRAARSP